ncbi:MAG TPA: sulfatase [Terriglobia bacterium]|nr:sulfatase [Terriglobia bacterium]
MPIAPTNSPAPTASPHSSTSRREILTRFVAISALAGLLLGIFEAGLLRSSPGIRFLLVPDIGFVEWFLAPLVDMACFALWGMALGLLAARRPGKHRIALLAAADLAAVAAFVALRIRWLHTRIVITEFTFGSDVLLPLAVFAAGFAVVAGGAYLLWKPISRLAGRVRFPVVRFLSWGLAAAAIVALCGVGYYLWRPFPSPGPAQSSGEPSARRATSPNIIFIVLDTVRADHLSSYGYSCPTTPNLDRLARRGVLFENAISPSSWTLASHASMFTGLLPHQNGADWWLPLPPGPRTFAETLRSSGYRAAGFAANFDYCQKGWGIGRGFDVYRDDSESLQRNLAGTLLGTALIQPAYQTFFRFDYLERQDARETNREAFQWLQHPPASPYFLFINYFDAHVPYLTSPSYNHRFGTVSDNLVHKLFDALQGPDAPRGITPSEQAALIAGYDNCLAFLDAQVGRLLDFLDHTPAGRNTIVIVTSDHGEEFGEQGFYSHGYNLYREAIHVPLIIAGPGVPTNVRISRLVRTRDLFSTVLDLAGGGKTRFTRDSLARFWNPKFIPQPFDNFAISELVPIFNEGGKQATISLTTPEWQYIYHSNGRQELYHWTVDPLNQVNLAQFDNAQATLADLRSRLIQVLADSAQPWRDQDYLFAHSANGHAFMSELLAARKPATAQLASKSLFIGASQALDVSSELPSSGKPPSPDQESLKSLPYH